MISKKKIKELKEMEYKKYLTTDYWKMVSEQAKHNANYKCQLCGKTNCQLNVHHNTYEHKGEEFLHMEDLICLCKECHESFHNQCKTIKQQEKLIEKLENEYAILRNTLESFRNSVSTYVKRFKDLIQKKECFQNLVSVYTEQLIELIQELIQEKEDLIQEKEYLQNKLDMWREQMPQHTLNEMQKMVEKTMQNHRNRPLPF